MAYSSIAGGLIMAALREKGEPLTFREIVKHIACNLGVQSKDFKDSIEIALHLGVQRGFIQKSGHRFFVKDEFPDEIIRAAAELVFKKEKEQTCQQKLVDQIIKAPQEQTSKNQTKNMVEVLSYSDEEDAMVFNILRPEASMVHSNGIKSTPSNGMGKMEKDSKSSDLTVESEDSDQSISIFDEQKDSRMSFTGESCSEDEQILLNIK